MPQPLQGHEPTSAVTPTWTARQEGKGGSVHVEAVGVAVTLARAGDHVVCSWNPHCGHCFYCDRGEPILCEAFTRAQPQGHLLDGASHVSLNGLEVWHFSAVSSHAECCVVHESSAVVVPRKIPLTSGSRWSRSTTASPGWRKALSSVRCSPSTRGQL
jgi:Zn-dependent alcohol dehydrogenase